MANEFLPGNLNRAEVGALTAAGVPQRDILPGNLNKTETDLLQESEPGVGSFSEIRNMIGKLLSAGIDTGQILNVMQSIIPGQQHILLKIIGEMMAAGASRNEISGADVGGRLAAGAPVSRFNQGGIVSLRRLTRPLGY